MKATDFLLVVLCAHVIAAAKTCMQEGEGCMSTAKKVVRNYMKICLSPDSQRTDDGGYNYATDLMTMCMLWHAFHDSIWEGDGDRILLYWKILLPIFHQEKHYNYAKEAFILLAQIQFFSEQKVTELRWSCAVNTHGWKGHNIPCDLHLEHLNCRLKCMIGNLGSNTNN